MDFENFKTFLQNNLDRQFTPGNIFSCPVAQYASELKGVPCWVNWDQVWGHNGFGDYFLVASERWIGKVVSIVDENKVGSISGSKILEQVAKI